MAILYLCFIKISDIYFGHLFCDNINHIIEALQDAIICLTPPRS